jgi:uncharacterized protein
MDHERYSDTLISRVLRGTKTIAMVGASDNPARPSYLVFKYLIERDYDVIPVNPGRAGTSFLGRRWRPSIARSTWSRSSALPRRRRESSARRWP